MAIGLVGSALAQVVMYGTMLGGVRDSDVLPFTADVDLIVARKYWPQVRGDSHGRLGKVESVHGYDTVGTVFLTIFRLEVCRSISLRRHSRDPDLLPSNIGILEIQVTRRTGAQQLGPLSLLARTSFPSRRKTGECSVLWWFSTAECAKCAKFASYLIDMGVENVQKKSASSRVSKTHSEHLKSRKHHLH